MITEKEYDKAMKRIEKIIKNLSSNPQFMELIKLIDQVEDYDLSLDNEKEQG